MKNIKDLYKEAKDEKDNEVDEKVVIMSRDDFIEEHKNLIGILRSGDKKLQEAEAKRQEAELAEETGETMDDDEDDE